MRASTKFWKFVVVITFVLSTISFAADTANSQVLPPNSSLFGKTLGEWSAAWWQYVFSIPASTNPLFDETGANCGVEQSGPVFFLVGVINVSGTATRTCTVPAGKALFFPILNVEDNNLEEGASLTVAELYKAVDGFVQLVTELHVSIDGKSVSNLFDNRALSPTFELTLPAVTPPEQNLEQAIGFRTPSTFQTIQPVVSDGFWIMIPSLRKGSHTINFGGTFGPPVNFTLDITYHLTVQ